MHGDDTTAHITETKSGCRVQVLFVLSERYQHISAGATYQPSAAAGPGYQRARPARRRLVKLQAFECCANTASANERKRPTSPTMPRTQFVLHKLQRILLAHKSFVNLAARQWNMYYSENLCVFKFYV